MDQNSVLDDIFSKFHHPVTPIFKERESLRSSYVPQSLPHRTDEITALANIVGPIMAEGTPSNAFLYGKTGAGKTAVSKFVLERLTQQTEKVGINFKYAYINCQEVYTIYRLWSTLAGHLGTSVPKTGLATAEVYEMFKEALDSKKIRLMIILDEIDFLLKRASDSLYNLTRMNSDLKYSNISIIGITNNVQFKEQIDARVRSTLTEQEIIFPPYTANQLKDILEERVNIGFEADVVDNSAIARAAALAASEHGDARRALDLLRVAGEIAESSGDAKVTSEHVKRASELIEKQVAQEVVNSLPLHSKMVVLAISTLYVRNKKDPKADSFTTTGEVYDEYIKICEALNRERLTQRRVGDLINELDMLGLITATVVSKGRYGRTRTIKLAVHESEIHKALEKDHQILEILPPYSVWSA